MKNKVWLPWLYIASILGVIFVGEAAVMISLPFFLPDSTSAMVNAFVDAAMLTMFSAPILWLLLIKPLQTIASDAAMRYSAVVSQSRDGILTLSASGVVETANAASLKLLGKVSADLVGRTLVDAIPELAQWKLPNNVSNPLDLSSGSDIFEVSLHREVGDEVYLEISIAQLRLGTAYQLTLGIRDISDRKLAEQVVAAANRKVVDAAHQAGKAEIATCVIHNVGNVLTNVNVLATAASNKVRQSKLSGLYKAAGLLRGHEADLENYLVNDERGRKIPAYIIELSSNLERESMDLLKNLTELIENLDHANEIVNAQQDFAGYASGYELMPVRELVDQALSITLAGLQRHSIEVVTEIASLPDAHIDRQKLVQVMVNLLKNAKEAFNDKPVHGRRIVVRVSQVVADRYKIDVIDNGTGIEESTLPNLFASGYSTKVNGHGIGLHYSVLALKQMGGELTVQSGGIGRGATFSLDLPMQFVVKELAS